MKPPWLKTPYQKPRKYRMWTDNTGEQATYNVDKATSKVDPNHTPRT